MQKEMIAWSDCIEQTGQSHSSFRPSNLFETFPYGLITLAISFSCIMSMTLCYECFGSAYGSWECLTKGPWRETHLAEPKIIKAICPNIWAQTLLNISLMMLKGFLFHFLLKLWGRVFTFPYESATFTYAFDIFKFKHSNIVSLWLCNQHCF